LKADCKSVYTIKEKAVREGEGIKQGTDSALLKQYNKNIVMTNQETLLRNRKEGFLFNIVMTTFAILYL
jgi:hypothetical protein